MTKPRGKDCAFVLTWADEEQPKLGDGISRTSDPRSRLWEINVWFGGNKPMRESIRALSKKQAIQFAKNRYPKATEIKLINNK